MTPNVDTSFPKSNETSIYTCITSTTKPATAIYWFENGRNITDMSSSTYDSNVSTSVLKYLPTVKHEGNLSCVAIYKYREHLISITKSANVVVQCSLPFLAIHFNSLP
ncbi:hypothetical protein DPMN_121255 [Dreissena polymorpha]|uniref:Ig-like domain-containing protein n=1 Tax=Dreissena polymorpha TaxID=45954 RepID=A0A9D4JTE5_DREPO|nr:hypothetical protein DPMN_121255 [Dreissena polymorpha]